MAQPQSQAKTHVVPRVTYDAKTGESFQDEIEIPLSTTDFVGSISAAIGATEMYVRYIAASYDFDYHVAQRRQFVINVNAGYEMTTSDGKSRVIPAGQLVFMEDIAGKGHKSRAIQGAADADKAGNSVFITITVPDSYRPVAKSS